MINFQELQLEVKEKYSFVGIERRDSKIIFCLPKGLNPAFFTTYTSKRDLFFLFYRVLNNFKKICLQKGYMQVDADIKTQDRDGVIRNQGSLQQINLPDVEIEENIFYSKLDLITSILSAYDEPKILSLAYRLGKSDKIDYSKLHLFLHRAVYLNNGAAYIDAMTLPRQMVHYQPTDIVGMYCYILMEVQQQLHEEISGEVSALAEQFKQRYIGAEYGLFHEEYSTQTVDTLKDALGLIDRNTAFKDSDYWDFYEAIELFLYGELSQVDEGEVWGIKNFHSVWESMCLTYLAKRAAPKCILQLDTKFLSDNVVALANSQTKILDLANVFRMNGSRLVPDAVVLSNRFNRIRSKEKNTFLLRKQLYKGQSWDDNGYTTTFDCELPNFSTKEFIKIAYRGQPPGIHTFSELENFYKVQSAQLIINFQLPSNFYSFWEIDVDKLINIDKLNELLDMMFQLNHIFYVALRKFIYTSNQFSEFLNEFIGNNVFSRSLFRDIFTINPDTKNYDTNNLVEMFKYFLEKVCVLNVIDIKYLPQEYFSNIDNCRYIKEESVRKQFVYEYVLQQFIENNDDCKIWEIKSSFWLPSWRDNSSFIEKVEPDYLDGYIDLRNINFAVIADSYID